MVLSIPLVGINFDLKETVAFVNNFFAQRKLSSLSLNSGVPNLWAATQCHTSGNQAIQAVDRQTHETPICASGRHTIPPLVQNYFLSYHRPALVQKAKKVGAAVLFRMLCVLWLALIFQIKAILHVITPNG